MDTINVPVVLLDSTVAFADAASRTTKRALEEIAVHRQTREKAAALAPAVLDHMVKLKVVPEAQKEAAAVMLGAPDTTLALLKNAADKIAELDAENAKLRASLGTKQGSVGELGAGVDSGGQAAGEFNSLRSPLLGVKTAAVKESDKPLLRLIGRGG